MPAKVGDSSRPGPRARAQTLVFRSKTAGAVRTDAGAVNATAPIETCAVGHHQIQPVFGHGLAALTHAGGETGGDDVVAALARIRWILEQAQRNGIGLIAGTPGDEVVADVARSELSR